MEQTVLQILGLLTQFDEACRGEHKFEIAGAIEKKINELGGAGLYETTQVTLVISLTAGGQWSLRRTKREYIPVPNIQVA